MSSCFIIQQVNKFIHLIVKLQFPDLQLPIGWHQCYDTVENLNHVIHSQAIIWQKPESGWVKLNMDGSRGGGGIVKFYGNCSNNSAEAMAMLKGIYVCLNNGLTNVIVETDSIIILNYWV
ncbi:hypothetical protein R3W88_027628 [Solanum pinnatisectum]|uniref:RNase H type-1 domain-containing protein n=1 Tax=Solanum pinnatisectum TaxID=50273 RepID=A0AAV9LJE9_9SOLN|nr:hypothetical protein R3W88_027628 [Solanum pinnatisectum]